MLINFDSNSGLVWVRLGSIEFSVNFQVQFGLSSYRVNFGLTKFGSCSVPVWVKFRLGQLWGQLVQVRSNLDQVGFGLGQCWKIGS